MKDNTSKSLVVLIALLVIVTLDLVTNIAHNFAYESQKAAGNARWGQVEVRMIEMERQIVELQEELEKLKQGG